MTIYIFDAQGGGMGRAVIARLKELHMEKSVIAVGTNVIALSNMMKTGAPVGASGENAVCYNAAQALEEDFIIAPIGFVLANSMLGEISPAIARAVSSCRARLILIPSNKCNATITGLKNQPLSEHIEEAIQKVMMYAPKNFSSVRPLPPNG